MNRTGTIKLFSLTTLFASMLPALQASASGFQVSEHSAAGLGRAFAGEAAIAEDASVVARNVAAMSFLEGPMFTGAISYIKPMVEVEATSVTSGATSRDLGVAREAVVPVFYYVTPINDKWALGVGGFTNYGVTTEYKDASVITTSANHSEVMSYNFNTSLSYKVQNNLSVGLGVNAVYVDARLTNSLPSAAGGATIMDVAGDDWGYGWNAGVFWEPVAGTRIGASYRSEVKTTLEGQSESDLYQGLGGTPQFNSKGSVDLNLPSIAEVSIWQRVNERVAVHASYMQIGWSSFDEIVVDLESNVKVADPQNYNDSSRWAVGMTYDYNDDLALRAGFAHDNSPVGNEDRSFRIPDSDRQWFTVGAHYTIDDRQSVDMGYAFLKADEVEIHDEEHDLSGEVQNGNAHIVSVQYNYRF